MGDLSITAGNMRVGANAKRREHCLAAVALTRSQQVYEASDGFRLADADLSAAAAKVAGYVEQDVAAGQYFTLVTEDDDWTPGTTLTLSVGSSIDIMVLSGTAGAMQKASDLAAGDYICVLGVVKTTAKMNYNPVLYSASVLTA